MHTIPLLCYKLIKLKSKLESKSRLPIISQFSGSHCKNAGLHVCMYRTMIRIHEVFNQKAFKSVKHLKKKIG